MQVSVVCQCTRSIYIWK